VQTIESTVRHVVRTQIGEWEKAAKTLLLHFRCVLRGFLPFLIARDNLVELGEREGFDDHTVEYIENAINLLDEQGKLLLRDSCISRLILSDTLLRKSYLNERTVDLGPQDGRWTKLLFSATRDERQCQTQVVC
jgi:hypothetical protein